MKWNCLKGFALGLGLAFGLACTAQATVINLYDGGTAGTLTSGVGNSLTFDLGGGHTLTVTSWYDRTTTNLAAATLGRYSPGLGVCDPGDGSPCEPPDHEVDNGPCSGVGCFQYTDWVLFSFDQAVNLKNVVIDPVGTYDTDANYFIGTGINGSNIAGKNTSLASLGTAELQSLAAVSSALRTVAFGASGTEGSFLLFGAHELPTDGTYDYFKIRSIEFDPAISVSEPVTWALMILGFAGLAILRRRNAARV